MNDHDTDPTSVLDALHDSLGDVTMQTPVEQIVAAGRARRRLRTTMVAGVAVATGLTLGVTTYGSSPPTGDAVSTGTSVLHIQNVAYTVDRRTDGTVHVTWDKKRYFEDREGLQAALGRAGFPVLIKVGEFCRGSDDDGTLGAGGVGAGVENVMKGEAADEGKVTFVFTPSAMPAGKQLFIGYLNDAQLAVTHGRPGSVERLVPIGEPLTCTTEAPPARPESPRDGLKPQHKD